jgi:foldase protein PrsA
VVALALLATFVLGACSDGGAGGLHPAAATVDGQRITDDEVARNVKVFTFLAGLNQQPCGTAVEGETPQAACARFAIGSLIQQHFVSAYATEHDLVVTQADKDAIVGQLEQSMGSAQAVDDALKSAGIGRTELNDLAGRILLFQKVQQAISADQADESTLRAQYEKDILSYTTIDTEHILVKTEAEAKDVYDKVTASGATEKDFLDLAKKISTDPSAKDNSGAIGPNTSPPLDAAYAAAAAALKPGEISRPVQSQFGWHVIRLVSKKVQSFAEAKATLAQQQGTQAFDTWLTEAVKAGDVDVNPKYGRFDAQTGTVQAVTSTATGSPSASGSQTPAGATPTPSS